MSGSVDKTNQNRPLVTPKPGTAKNARNSAPDHEHHLLPDQIVNVPKMPPYMALSPADRTAAEQRSSGQTYPQRAIQNDKGIRNEPVNMVITGTPDELVNALEDAGWYRADDLNTISGLKSLATVANRLPVLRDLYHFNYQSAPLSDQFLGGKPYDMAFEKDSQNDLARDHLRVWDTGRRDALGRPVWEVAASRDIGVKIDVKDKKSTHLVDPRLDLERDQVMANLLSTGDVQDWNIAEGQMDPADAASTKQKYKTDGKVYNVTLTPQPDLPYNVVIHQPSRVRRAFHHLPPFVQKGVEGTNERITQLFKKITG